MDLEESRIKMKTENTGILILHSVFIVNFFMKIHKYMTIFVFRPQVYTANTRFSQSLAQLQQLYMYVYQMVIFQKFFFVS